MNYNLLLFDADDTLFDYEKGESFALISTMEFYGINLSKQEIFENYRYINKNIWLEFENGQISAAELKVERFRRFLRQINVKNKDPKKISKSYLEFLSKSTFLLPNVTETLEKCSKNFRMAIITNGLKEVQRARFRDSEIFNYIEEIFISDEIGIAKPNPKIFDIALNELNHSNKSSVLMIGDKLSSDIQGGINAGIDTCWINSQNQTNTSLIRPTYEIRNILELTTMVLRD